MFIATFECYFGVGETSMMAFDDMVENASSEYAFEDIVLSNVAFYEADKTKLKIAQEFVIREI